MVMRRFALALRAVSRHYAAQCRRSFMRRVGASFELDHWERLFDVQLRLSRQFPKRRGPTRQASFSFLPRALLALKGSYTGYGPECSSLSASRSLRMLGLTRTGVRVIVSQD